MKALTHDKTICDVGRTDRTRTESLLLLISPCHLSNLSLPPAHAICCCIDLVLPWLSAADNAEVQVSRMRSTWGGSPSWILPCSVSDPYLTFLNEGLHLATLAQGGFAFSVADKVTRCVDCYRRQHVEERTHLQGRVLSNTDQHLPGTSLRACLPEVLAPTATAFSHPGQLC